MSASCSASSSPPLSATAGSGPGGRRQWCRQRHRRRAASAPQGEARHVTERDCRFPTSAGDSLLVSWGVVLGAHLEGVVGSPWAALRRSTAARVATTSAVVAAPTHRGSRASDIIHVTHLCLHHSSNQKPTCLSETTVWLWWWWWCVWGGWVVRGGGG